MVNLILKFTAYCCKHTRGISKAIVMGFNRHTVLGWMDNIHYLNAFNTVAGLLIAFTACEYMSGGALVAAPVLVFGPWLSLRRYLFSDRDLRRELAEFTWVCTFLVSVIFVQIFIPLEISNGTLSLAGKNYMCLAFGGFGAASVGSLIIFAVMETLAYMTKKGFWEDPDTGRSRKPKPKSPGPLPVDAVDTFFRNLETSRQAKNVRERVDA